MITVTGSRIVVPEDAPRTVWMLERGEGVTASRAWAIARGDRSRVIPWQMGVVAKLLRVLPNALLDKALAGRARKAARSANGTGSPNRHSATKIARRMLGSTAAKSRPCCAAIRTYRKW